MVKSKIKNCILIEPNRHSDSRGFFAELYSKSGFQKLGVDVEFVQHNHSVSKGVGTLRGLHFQAPPRSQAKLVRCGRGSLFDVAVDIRIGSPSFGQWEGYELSEKNGRQLYIPVGFAHGFVSLESFTEIVYQCSNYYAPELEGGLLWCDSQIGVDWPLSSEPIISDKDLRAPSLEGFESPFFYGVNS
jgi:dTDP-4-dehydrorhamnose 3,5-epimerase